MRSNSATKQTEDDCPPGIVAALRAAANRYGGTDSARKRDLLRRASVVTSMDADTLLAYHDVLLFLLAYPESATMRAHAARELTRVAAALCAIDAAGPARARSRLHGSGVAWSSITIAFSYPIARWLLARYPGAAEIDSFGDGGDLLAEWLRHALPPAEFALVDAGEGDADALLDGGVEGWKGGRLGWLVAQFERLPCDGGLREGLFDSLQLFLTLRPRDTTLSRTFARGLAAPIHFHRAPLMRGADVEALIATPLPAARRAWRRECAHLVDAARATLAMLGRETDPITHADVGRTRYVDLGRGVAIALYSARPERRNPLDSHIGYVLFKNAVPVGYGGGWPFLGRCKIGINIFTAFRGGESAFLMASVLRVYAQLFRVERFIVEPYQFGAGNREGLESGALWFYYRLGFRPVDAALRALAAAEFARMTATRGYRPALAVLRRFTRSDLECVVVPGTTPACDPGELSDAVTAWIAAEFGGRRDRAIAFAERRVMAGLGIRTVARWRSPERAALRALAPVLAQIDDLESWPKREKILLVSLIRAKGGDEFRYFALMDGLERLREAMNGIVDRRIHGPQREIFRT